ncbi:MAG: helix-turn-helix domain-containing protein [Rhodospirillales bacterium]
MGSHPNGALLRVARQRKGFPQGEAAARLAVPQVSLSRYENGISAPGDDFILRASILYELPASFFVQPDAVFGAPVSVHPLWRKKHDVTGRELDAIVAELNIRAMHLRRLLDAVEFYRERIFRALISKTMAAMCSELLRWCAPIG